MITAFKNKLLICICIVLVLLAVCVCVDYADENITINNTANSMIKVNDTDRALLVDDNLIEPNPNRDKVHTVKKTVKKYKSKTPLVTITAKPSVQSGYAYKWYTMTWVDYCPNCHRYNCLLINPKGVPERELTCSFCSSDFCGVTGKEKYSWSRVYLRRS